MNTEKKEAILLFSEGKEVKMPEQINTLTTEYRDRTTEKQDKIFQVPSMEERARISGKIVLGRDEDATGPQCPGSQCFTSCSRC